MTIANEAQRERSLLHIDCGRKRKEQTLPAFQSADWNEVQFDIDESVEPEIIGTMTDMSAVGCSSMGGLRSISPISFSFCSQRTAANPNNIFGLKI